MINIIKSSIYYTIFFLFCYSCKSNKIINNYKYEIISESNTTSKFKESSTINAPLISYNHLLFEFILKRNESTIYDMGSESTNTKMWYDTLSVQVVNSKNSKFYLLSKFEPLYSVIDSGFYINSPVGLKVDLGQYKTSLEKLEDVRDTIIQRQNYKYLQKRTLNLNGSDSLMSCSYFMKHNPLITPFICSGFDINVSNYIFAGLSIYSFSEASSYTLLIHSIIQLTESESETCEAIAKKLSLVLKQ